MNFYRFKEYGGFRKIGVEFNRGYVISIIGASIEQNKFDFVVNYEKLSRIEPRPEPVEGSDKVLKYLISYVFNISTADKSGPSYQSLREIDMAVKGVKF